MKILFIGGTGNISWFCCFKALEAGHDVWTLNRGESLNFRRRPLQTSNQIVANIRDVEQVRRLINNVFFDVVVDFICYTPEQAMIDYDLFNNQTRQFIFISSAANYQKKAINLPYTESVNLSNSYWEYTKNKIECEKIFLKYYREKNFPVTIVRPGHTYDTIIPDAVGFGDWTNAKRMLTGKPIIIHGDGSNLWTLTHSEDFANAFIELFNNKEAIGEAFHITSDEWLTWREIIEETAFALNVKNPNIVYIPSDIILKLNPKIGKGLIGHKTWCDIYDNSKIKSIAKNWKAEITFKQGIKRTINWLKADMKRQRCNNELDLFLDNLCDEFKMKNI